MERKGMGSGFQHMNFAICICNLKICENSQFKDLPHQ